MARLVYDPTEERERAKGKSVKRETKVEAQAMPKLEIKRADVKPEAKPKAKSKVKSKVEVKSEAKAEPKPEETKEAKEKRVTKQQELTEDKILGVMEADKTYSSTDILKALKLGLDYRSALNKVMDTLAAAGKVQKEVKQQGERKKYVYHL